MPHDLRLPPISELPTRGTQRTHRAKSRLFAARAGEGLRDPGLHAFGCAAREEKFFGRHGPANFHAPGIEGGSERVLLPPRPLRISEIARTPRIPVPATALL